MKLLERYFDAAFATPDGIYKLRELILALAMRGRLVSQDADEPMASDLLKKIATVRARLVREGVVKAARAPLEINESDLPYALPQKWQWVRLDELAPMSITDGDWIESKDQDPSGDIRLVQLADVGVNEFKNVSERYINAATFKRLSCTELRKGDVLVARLPNPIGRACVFPGLKTRAITAVDVAIFRPLDLIDTAFLVHVINSPFFKKQVHSFGKGATRFRIATGNLKQVLTPVPPLPEQKRIVAKIDKLMARCDELEELRAKRERNQNELLDFVMAKM